MTPIVVWIITYFKLIENQNIAHRLTSQFIIITYFKLIENQNVLYVFNQIDLIITYFKLIENQNTHIFCIFV